MTITADFRPAKVTLRGRRGDEVSARLVGIDGDGNPIDWSGDEWRAQIRLSEDASLEVDATFDETDAGTGIVIATFDLAGLNGDYVWDWENLTEKRTYVAGPAIVDPDVSHA